MSHPLEEGEPLPATADVDQTPDPVPEPSRRERLQATAVRLKEEAVNLLSGLERIRPESRTVSAGFLIFERDREFPTSLLTGALAARVVIFLIPFLALIVFAIGLGVDFAEVSAAEAAQEAGLPGMFAAAAEDSAATSGQLRFTGLLFTSFAMVWAANALGKAMRLSTSVVWRTPRGRVQRRWLVPLSVITFSLLALGANGIAHQTNRPGALDDILRLIIELVLIAGLWLVASRYLPHDPEANQWRDFAPGALLMAIAVVALQAAIIFYLAPKWATLSERYGEIGFVLVLLSFAYIIGFAAVASAHVNSAAFYTRRDPTQVAPEDRSNPLLDLLREERETWRGQAD
jgi:uncharacterized BrkB/YihY/UPF0761 family membrane protein